MISGQSCTYVWAWNFKIWMVFISIFDRCFVKPRWFWPRVIFVTVETQRSTPIHEAPHHPLSTKYQNYPACLLNNFFAGLEFKLSNLFFRSISTQLQEIKWPYIYNKEVIFYFLVTFATPLILFFRLINIIKYGYGQPNLNGPAHGLLPFWHSYYQQRYIFYSRE